jgi:hypothetical protein
MGQDTQPTAVAARRDEQAPADGGAAKRRFKFSAIVSESEDEMEVDGAAGE